MPIHPSNNQTELMARARRNLDRRLLEAPAIREALIAPAPPPGTTRPSSRNAACGPCANATCLPFTSARATRRPKDSGAYVPASAANLENDPNLTDGARRCARKLMEETHRRDRKERTLQVNVSYLAKGLGRCRRTVQRYLAMLEREGYSASRSWPASSSRMCIGLIVQLLPSLFPRHQREVMAGEARKSAKTSDRRRRNPQKSRCDTRSHRMRK